MSKRRLSRLGKQTQSNIGAWNSLAVKIGEMMLASAETIAHRSQGMARMGTRPLAQDLREIQRQTITPAQPLTPGSDCLGPR